MCTGWALGFAVYGSWEGGGDKKSYVFGDCSEGPYLDALLHSWKT